MSSSAARFVSHSGCTLASTRRVLAPSSAKLLSPAENRRPLIGRPMSTVVDNNNIANTPSPPPPAPAVAPGSVEARREANAREIFKKAVAATAPRNNWTKEEIAAIYYQPLMELAYQAVSALLDLCYSSSQPVQSQWLQLRRQWLQ